jgi:hypothetical protein
MTRKQKARLIAAATLLSALALPRASSAQFPPGTVYGDWIGNESYTTSVYQSGQLIDSYSGSGPAGFSFFAEPVNEPSWAMFLELAGGDPFSDVKFVAILGTDPFGPSSAIGSLFPVGGPGGQSTGNFFLTYQSILPDGQIDVGGGTATVDLTQVFFPNPGAETITFAAFQSPSVSSLPEPASIVHAALAVLVIAIVAWMRGFRPRQRARLA